MKIEILEDEYRIFIMPQLLGDVNWDDKEKVIDEVTSFFKKIISNYSIELDGFYKVSIYPSNVGVLMDVVLIDDYNYGEKSLDFRMVVYLNKRIYFRTLEFDVVSDCLEVYYDGEFFYTPIDFLNDKFIYICEFGDIIVDKGDLVFKLIKKD